MTLFAASSTSRSTAFWIMFSVGLLMFVQNTVHATITTYPLVPHHEQRMRRHRERRALMKGDDHEEMAAMEEEHPRASAGDHPGHSSMIRRREEAMQVGALYQGYGTHYIDLWCGSPPQRQTVIVDTGSGVTAFPCTGCRDCGVPKYHIDQLFDETTSSTFRRNSCDGGCVSSRSHCSSSECHLSMSYAEGSRWDAFEAVDSCYVGGPHEQPLVEDDGGTDALDPLHAKNFAFDLVFGCQTLVTGLFKTQLADGIMGMDSRNEAFWSQMHMAGKMGTEKQFSLCFSRSPTAEKKGTEAGAMTLGGVDERFDTSPMVFTPDASKGRSGFFSVKVRRVWLRDGSAGESAKSSKDNPNEGVKALETSQAILNTGGIIVDSGTTDTYWNSGIAAEFKKVFKEMSGREHTNAGLKLTHDELMALPTILFQLESTQISNADVDNFQTTGLAGALDPQHPYDVLLAFPPSHYMEYDPDKDTYTSRFYVTEHRGSVLGANAMMGHNILFDSDMDRIGWAESHCDYTNLVTANGYDFSITGKLQTVPPNSSNSGGGGANGGGGTPPVPDNVPGTPPPVTTPTEPVPAPVPAPTSPTTPEGTPSTTTPISPPTTPAAPPLSPPASTSTSTSTSTNLPPMTTQGLTDAYKQFVQNCDTVECRIPIVVGFAILLCCGICFFYTLNRCCCGGRSSSSSHHDVDDYKPVETTADDVELVGFRDEPSDDDDDDDDDDEDDGQPSKPTPPTTPNNGTNGHGAKKFQDSKEPEFQGDFI